MNRLVPDSNPLPARLPSPFTRRAEVRSPAGLEPASGSVSANEEISSPEPGRAGRPWRCAGEPNFATTWPAMPLLVPNMDRNAGLV